MGVALTPELEEQLERVGRENVKPPRILIAMWRERAARIRRRGIGGARFIEECADDLQLSLHVLGDGEP